MGLLTGTVCAVRRHGDEYFDQIDGWLELLDVGTRVPRDPIQVQASLRDFVLANPLLAPYQDDPRLQALQQQLKEKKS